MGFFDRFKRIRDDEEEQRIIKLRQPQRQPKQSVSVPKSMRVKISTPRSNNSFSQQTQPQQREQPQIKIQQPQAPPRSHSLTNRFDKFLSGGVQEPDYNNYSTLRKISDTNRRLIERAIPTPRQDSPDYDSTNPVHAIGTGARGLLRSNINAIPTLASDTLSGFQRLVASGHDEAIFKVDAIKRQMNAKNWNEAEKARLANDQFIRDFYANKPGYTYSPLFGKTNTIQQENLYRKDVLGQSRTKAGAHALLDTALPFFDIADFGASSAVKSIAPAMKFGVPFVGGFLRRAKKVTPEAVQVAKKSNLLHDLKLGKNVNDGKMIRDNFVEFPTNPEVTTTNIQLRLNEIEPGQQGVYLLSDIMDNPNYFDTVDPKEIPQVVINKTDKPGTLTNGYYDRNFNTIFLEVPTKYDTVRDGKIFTNGVTEREQARHVASVLEHEMTHGATKTDSLFPSGSNPDYYKKPVTVAAKQLNVPNSSNLPNTMYRGTYGELLAETDRVRYNMSPLEREQIPYQETFDKVVKQKQLNANEDILYPLVDPNTGNSYTTTGRQSPFSPQESALYKQSTDKPAAADNILNGWANTSKNNNVNKYLPEGGFYDDYGREVDEFGNIITDGKYNGKGKEFADVPGYGENPFAIFGEKIKEITKGIYPKSQAKVSKEITKYSPNSKMSDTEFGGGTIPNDLFDREAASPDFIGRVADIKGSLTDESLAAIRENTRKTAGEGVSSRNLTSKEVAEIETRTPQIDNSVKINGEVLQEAIKDSNFSSKDVEKLIAYLDGSATGKVPAKVKSAAKRFEEIIKARAKVKAKKFVIKVKEKQTVARANEMLDEITNAARAKDDNILKLNPPKPNKIKIVNKEPGNLMLSAGAKPKGLPMHKNKVKGYLSDGSPTYNESGVIKLGQTTPAVEQMSKGARPLGPNSIDDAMKRTPPSKWAKDSNYKITKNKSGKIKIVDKEKKAKVINEREIREEKLAKMSMQSGDKTRMNKTLGTIIDNLLGMIVPGGYNVQRQGRGGKALRKQSRGYVQDKLTFSGKYKAKFKDIQHKYNLTKDEVEQAIEIVRERKVEGASSSTKQAAKELTNVFEEMYKVSNEGPLKSKHRKGYFPQYANKDAYRLKEGERRYEKAIDDIMNLNENLTREEAIKALKEFRDASHGKTSGHLRKKRKKTMPAWLTINNFDAALAYADEVADDYASLKNFGVNDAYANAAFALIDETGFNVKKAKKYWEQVAGRENPDWKKTGADVATGFTTATTLSTSVPKNLTQNVNTMIVAGILNTARGAGKTAKKFLKYNPEMAKANVWDDNIVFQEAGIKNANDIAKYAMYVFSQAERFMRETAGEAAKLNADQLYKKAQSAKKGSWKAKTVTRRLKKIGISESDFVNGSLKEDAKLRAMRNISDRTQFRMDADNVPLWSTTPLGRMFSQWQKFNYVQTMFMWDEVLTEAAHKNIAPLVTATIMTPVIGIPAMMAAKIIRGQDPTDFDDKDAWDAFEGLTGIPGSIYGTAKWQKEFNEDDRNSDTAKRWKTAGSVLGPTASLIADTRLTADAYKNVKAENEKKGLSKGDEGWEDPMLYTYREGAEKIPYVGPFVKNTAFKYPGQNNLFNRDEKARGPAEFYAQEGNPVGLATKNVSGKGPIEVSRVKDADTVVIKNGQVLRIDGINAPESDTDMGKQATNFTANFVQGKKVELVYDVDENGVYNREIVDITVNGKSLAEELLKNGYARASTYGANSKNVKKYQALQKEAQDNKRGFWGDPNAQVKLGEQGLGKDPSRWSTAIRLNRGKDETDFTDSMIDDFKDISYKDAKKLAKEKKYNLTDQELFQVRVAADGYADYFQGGYKNASDQFPSDEPASLKNKLIAAYKEGKEGSPSSKLDDVYTDENYSDAEKEAIYDLMGFTEEEAERNTLNIIKDNGMDDASPVIDSYLRDKGYTDDNAKALIEDGTITKPQVKSMYEQDLISDEEYDSLMYLLKTKNDWSKSGTGKGGNRSKNDGNRTGKSSKGKKKKKNTIKLTPYKVPEMKDTKKDYFGELMKNLDAVKSPTIKIKSVPKKREIDTTFKVNVPKEKKRAKIKVDFDTGLI